MEALAGMGLATANPPTQDIFRVQAKLKELGYYKSAVDGVWGPGSQEALRAFKKNADLGDDGSWSQVVERALLGTSGTSGLNISTGDTQRALPDQTEHALDFPALKAKAESGDPAAQYDLGLQYEKGGGVSKDIKQAAGWFMKAAEKGYTKAEAKVGELYGLFGDRDSGLSFDPEKSMAWYTKAAEKGLAEAQYALGYLYATWYLKKDSEKAAELFSKAAAQGNSPAQVSLGDCYANGEGMPKDPKKAVEWYTKAARLGDTEGERKLAKCYGTGEGVTKDPKKAFELYSKAAETDEVFAPIDVGDCYITGLGVPKDPKKAVEWYSKAAKNVWNSDAVFRLGLCFAEGEGVEKDIDKAMELWRSLPKGYDNYQEHVECYRNATEGARGEAQAQVAEWYLEGDIVSKDVDKARKWYQKAADQGYAPAQTWLGAGHEYGFAGMPKNLVQAMGWYRKAAEQEHAYAQYRMGLFYAKGEGVPKNMQQAAYWFQRSAEKGIQWAQLELGICYAKGEGVPKDLVAAYMWFNIVAAQGEDAAVKNRSIAEQQMTPDQIARAQQLSAAFVPKTAGKDGGAPSNDNATSPTPDKLAGSGTGFFVTTDGWLVTNAHVATAGKKVMVKLGDTLYPAAVKQVDAANDLALIKVEDEWVDVPLLGNEGTAKDPAQSKTEGQFSALALERAGGVTLGASVFTVGFPNPGLQGYSPKMTKGEISSLAGSKDDPRYFQISAPIQPGNSGGALADESGNVVGVVSAMISDKAAIETTGAIPQNVNYAVKSTYLLALVESIPEAAKGLKEPVKTQDFAAAVQAVEKASAMVLMFE
jgi:TPR repeat protein